jgi:nucleolar protein 15
MVSSNKRKGSEGASEVPTKKTKTAANSDSKVAKKSKVAASTTPTADFEAPILKPARKTKIDRKTAAEFFDNDDAAPKQNTTTEKPKPAKAIKKAAATAIADQSDTTPQVEDTAVDAAVDKSKTSKKIKRATTEAVIDELKPSKKSKSTVTEEPAGEPEPTKKTKKALKNIAPVAAIETLAEAPTSTYNKAKKANDAKAAEDAAAARQLRAENGEPITPFVGPAVELEKSKSKDKKAKKDKSSKKMSTSVEEDAELSNEMANNDFAIIKNGTADAKIAATKNAADEVEAEEPIINGVPAVDETELLNGFDSDSPDDAQDVGLDLNETLPISDPSGKIEKELRAAHLKSGPDDQPGTIYIGHIPHGFFEVQMRAFFSQFGDITRIRLSRNRRTGASKHFAFIEFASEEVAKIAAKTMDGYLMFGHLLKSKFAPADSLHPDVWKGANKKFHKIPHAKLEGAKLAEAKSVEQWEKKAAKEESRRKKKAKALKKMGYDAPESAVAAAKEAKEGEKKGKKAKKEKKEKTAEEEGAQLF